MSNQDQETSTWLSQICSQTIYVTLISFVTGVLGTLLLTYGATAIRCDTYEPTRGMAAAIIMGCILTFAYFVYSLAVAISWRKHRQQRVTQHVALSEEGL
jgi:uncharacterized membrane protein YbhN (UPF0104 family)